MRAWVFLLALAVPLQALAATPTRKGKKPKVEEVRKTRPAAPTPEAANLPLSEISETLGALSLLQEVCAPKTSSNPWRIRMEALVEAEGAASGARERMNGAYNRGYAEYATSYSRCTPAAKAAQEALRRDAARMARGLNQRFGG